MITFTLLQKEGMFKLVCVGLFVSVCVCEHVLVQNYHCEDISALWGHFGQS